MPFTIIPCPISGLYEIQPKIFGDNRGYFLETYSEKDFSAAGLDMHFVQDNQSRSVKGVLRGLHFQKHHPQGKLVRALSGQVYDVAVDIRTGSPSFGKYYGVVLDSEKQNQFYIPEGFAHGFFVLSETAEGGLMWNDPLIGINWTAVAPDVAPVLSEKDTQHPAFNPGTAYFDIHGRWCGI